MALQSQMEEEKNTHLVNLRESNRCNKAKGESTNMHIVIQKYREDNSDGICAPLKKSAKISGSKSP